MISAVAVFLSGTPDYVLWNVVEGMLIRTRPDWLDPAVDLLNESGMRLEMVSVV